MNNVQSRKKNYLQRVAAVQALYHEKSNAFFEEWGWRPTKKRIWAKFIYPEFKLAYHTFIEQMQIDVEAETQNLETDIHQTKREIQEMKKQINLFTIAAALLLLLPGCANLKDLLAPQGTRYTDAQLAAKCAELYPVTDSLATDTLDGEVDWWLPEEIITYIDTTVCPPSDSIPHTIIDTIRLKVPGKRIYVPYTVVDSTWWRRDSAGFAALQLENNNLRTANAALTANCQLRTGELPTDGLPWWWLLLTAVGGFLIRHFGSTNKPKT